MCRDKRCPPDSAIQDPIIWRNFGWSILGCTEADGLDAPEFRDFVEPAGLSACGRRSSSLSTRACCARGAARPGCVRPDTGFPARTRSQRHLFFGSCAACRGSCCKASCTNDPTLMPTTGCNTVALLSSRTWFAKTHQQKYPMSINEFYRS